MKRQVLLTVIFILVSHLLLAQGKTDTIGTARGWLGGKWNTYEGKKIRTTYKLTTIIRQDPEAYKIYKKTRRDRAIGLSLDCIGLGLLVTSDIYLGYSHPSNPLTLLYAAAGCELIALPFAILTVHNQKKAIKKFNSDALKTSYNERKPQLYFSFTGTTMGIGLRF